ncbi:hypothetical protein [Dielma fastidiosa]|uniref:Uncharacterized protein n=1 Tax=Dielma fastidiosa TaxID=1034346 RepID=A0A318KQP2_9FIRM|nr:hypothetical protein [Dielma fastidiosa]PXX80020.1 hypothetical protein DES51_10422 [Dielma fastidiosa]
MEDNEQIFCPIVERMINIINCIVCRDVVDKQLIETCLEAEFNKDDFREKCKNCKYYAY